MEYMIYIGAALVIGLLIGFIALSVTWLRKTMLRNVRSHTLELLSVYDDLLREKSDQLADISREIQLQEAESAAHLEKQESPVPISEAQAGVSPSTLLAMAEQATETSYRDSSIGNTYHQIKQNFSFDMEEILPSVAAGSSAESGPAGRLLNELDYDTVYSLSTLNEEDQLSVLNESLSEEGQKLVNEYLQNRGSFNVFSFYDYLKSRKAEEPQGAKLYVPVGMAGRVSSTNGVDITVDREICEGFQVEMGGKLYDYCIKTKELS